MAAVAGLLAATILGVVALRGRRTTVEPVTASGTSEEAKAAAEPTKPRIKIGLKGRKAIFDDSDDAPPAPPPQPPETAVAAPPPTLPPATANLPWHDASWSALIESHDAISVDGVDRSAPATRWPLRPWPVVLPPGHHILAIGKQAKVQDQTASFPDYYAKQAAKYCDDKQRYVFEQLAAASRPGLGRFSDPLLPHFWGNYWWQEKRPDAAIRAWKTAIRIEPAFAPSHLNLAYAFQEGADPAQAEAELAIAAALNVQDGYGIARHIRRLRDKSGDPQKSDPAVRFEPRRYVDSMEELQEPHAAVVNLLTSLGSHAGHAALAASWNNAAVYLQREGLNPILVMQCLGKARDTLVAGGLAASPADTELTQSVLHHMTLAAHRAGMSEERLYADLENHSKAGAR